MTLEQSPIWTRAQSTPALAQALAGRAQVFAQIAEAEAAVIHPQSPGALTHGTRKALAARVARLSGAEVLAESYAATLPAALSALADPGSGPDALGDGLAPEVLRFVDRVAAQTRDVAADDIAALRRAGVAEADIVRLCELVACISFVARVAVSLELMGPEA